MSRLLLYVLFWAYNQTQTTRPATYITLKSKPMLPEESFQSAVIHMARLWKWKVAHFRKARTKRGWRTAVSADGKGWPDLLLCHEERGIILARELKIPPNKLTPEQEDWLRVLSACGIDAKVWTTRDWPEIEQTLR